MWRVCCNIINCLADFSYFHFHSTLEERAKRLFATKGFNISDIDKSLFARSHKSRGDPTERQKEIAMIESQIYQLVELLSVRKLAVMYLYLTRVYLFCKTV